MIVCPKCGAKDAYYTEMKANNEVARCLECSAFIKNIPHSEPTFYFGKYKDKKVSEVTDADYLNWVLANTKQSKNMRDAIEQKIASLPQHN